MVLQKRASACSSPLCARPSRNLVCKSFVGASVLSAGASSRFGPRTCGRVSMAICRESPTRRPGTGVLGIGLQGCPLRIGLQRVHLLVFRLQRVHLLVFRLQRVNLLRNRFQRVLPPSANAIPADWPSGSAKPADRPSSSAIVADDPLRKRKTSRRTLVKRNRGR